MRELYKVFLYCSFIKTLKLAIDVNNHWINTIILIYGSLIIVLLWLIIQITVEFTMSLHNIIFLGFFQSFTRCIVKILKYKHK